MGRVPTASRKASSKSRRAPTEEIGSSLFDRIDDETRERLEEALILADAGATTTAQVVEKLEYEVDSGAVPPDGAAIKERLIGIPTEIAFDQPGADQPQPDPAVVLMTESTAPARPPRSARSPGTLRNEFWLSVLLGADTYRAAAAEQLATWAERAGADLSLKRGCDPSSVAFDAINAARSRGPML